MAFLRVRLVRRQILSQRHVDVFSAGRLETEGSVPRRLRRPQGHKRGSPKAWWTVTDVPPWLAIARREIGVKEKFGVAENARILQYHGYTKLKANSEETPWCASFIAFCLENAGIRSTRSAAAASYITWGEQCMAKPGAVVVLSKADPDAGGSGHVGFFDHWDEDRSFFWMTGGNQSQAVSKARRPTSRIVAVRWPRNE